MKVCSNCNESKLTDQFSKQKRGRQGLKSECRACCAIKFKAWAEKNKEHQVKRIREYRERLTQEEKNREAVGLPVFTRTQPKICSACNETKPPEDFSMRRGRAGGLTSHCKKCSSAKQMERYRVDIDGSRKKAREQAKAYRRANPDVVWSINLKTKFGITKDDYTKMLLAQGGRCAICARDNPGRTTSKNFHVDHDHGTGKVRALLCSPCNFGLGALQDKPEIVEAAAAYLRRHKQAA